MVMLPHKAKKNMSRPKKRKRSRVTFAQILYAQKGQCKDCGQVVQEGGGDLDHIVPFSISGDDAHTNLQVLCSLCHARKTRLHDIPASSKARSLRKHIVSSLECLQGYIDTLYSQHVLLRDGTQISAEEIAGVPPKPQIVQRDPQGSSNCMSDQDDLQVWEGVIAT